MNNYQTTPTTQPASPEFPARVHLGRPWGSQWRCFEADMGTLGLDVHECNGSGGWGGPAVTVRLAMFDTIIGATMVKLDHHAEGEGNVMLYPAAVQV